jgi:hypothetical protein
MRNSKILTPAFIIGLLLLLINDFFLKQHYHNWLTGKLSDFAGLFIFPIFLTYLFPKKAISNYVFTALFFVFWKLEYSSSLLFYVNETFGSEFSRTIDDTDLIALFILPISYLYQNNAKEMKISYVKPIVIAVAIFSFFATSAPDLDTAQETLLTGGYHYRWQYERFNKDVLIIGYENKKCETCYDEVIGPDIKAYGWNENFIIAQLNPIIKEQIDSTKLVYAIIDVPIDYTPLSAQKGIYINLSEKEFLLKRKRAKHSRFCPIHKILL